MPTSEFQNAPDLVNALKKEITAGNVQGAKEIIRMLSGISASDMKDLFDTLYNNNGDLGVCGWMCDFLFRSKESYSEDTYNDLKMYGENLYFEMARSEIKSAIVYGHLDKYKHVAGIITANERLYDDGFFKVSLLRVFEDSLIEAGNNGHLEMIEYFYSELNEDKIINSLLLEMWENKNIFGFVDTYFKLSVKDHGRLEIDHRHYQDERTLIMIAAGYGRLDLVKLLESKGADLSLFDYNGNTVLSHALSSGDRGTIKYVLSLCKEESVADELLRHGKNHYPLSTIPFEKWMIRS